MVESVYTRARAGACDPWRFVKTGGARGAPGAPTVSREFLDRCEEELHWLAEGCPMASEVGKVVRLRRTSEKGQPGGVLAGGLSVSVEEEATHLVRVDLMAKIRRAIERLDAGTQQALVTAFDRPTIPEGLVLAYANARRLRGS